VGSHGEILKAAAAMTVHIREEETTDPAWGQEPAQRSVAELVRLGVVLLDKPSGPTSREAAERAGRLVGACKVGHGGVLDPKVTGVLPLLLNKATKAQGVFSRLDKAYRGLMRLHGEVTDEELAQAISMFTGRITQVPPRRSRVKRQARQRSIHSFEVCNRDGRMVEFTVQCQAGTYIRKLIHDLGEHIGCGAHMLKLRRTRSGPFTEAECSTTAQIEDAAAELKSGNEAPLRQAVRPLEDVINRILPRIWVDDRAVNSLCLGCPLAVPGVCRLEEFKRGTPVALMTLKGELIAIGQSQMSHEEILNAQKGIAATTHKVFMEPGTYPIWKGTK